MATAHTSLPLCGPTCVACGEVAVKRGDRRSLRSSASEHVLPLWKSTIEKALEKVRMTDLEETGTEQMCRRCFYAYEKVLKAHAVIEGNAAKAVRVLSTQATTAVLPPAPKRRPPPVSSSGTESESPSVSVS